MKLVASLTSPFARKVRAVFLEKGISYELHESIPWTPDSDVPHYNPLGRVPVLIDHQDKAWTDSSVIAEYLETVSEAHCLIPKTPIEAVAVKQIEAFADGMCEAGIAIFLERNRDNNLRSRDWIQRQLNKLERCFTTLNEQLECKEFSHGKQFSLGDIAIICMLQWISFRLPDVRWQKFPQLVRFNDLHKTRRCLADTAPE